MERIIKKTITRTINTAQYENLVLTVGFEESLKARSEADWDKKVKSLTQKLINEYLETESNVFSELQLKNKPAHIKKPSPQKVNDVDFKEIFD
jgi:hypothetical protein|tara:strand:+ start:339 stop:617 length:279 start_codon:yes stop_codon:yes gene_type:complete